MTTTNNNQITLPVSGTPFLKILVIDLVETNKQAYNFINSLNKVLEGDISQATTTDLNNFAQLIEDFNGRDDYFLSELLYMLEVAFKEVEA